MKKIIIAFVGIVSVVTLTSSVNMRSAVYFVEDGYYFHHKGNCALKDRGRSGKKIYITTTESAVENGYHECEKCH